MGIKTRLIKLKNLFRYEVQVPVYIPVKTGEYLKDKSILVTGGASGIGFSIAEACLRNGANIVIAGRNKCRLDKASDLLKKKIKGKIGHIDTIVIDINDVELIESRLNNAIELFPNKRIDILVNNAGVSYGNNIGSTDSKSYDKVLDTNLKGTYFMSQFFSNYLIKNKIKGNILNITSSSSVRPAISPYMLSKWGQLGLTQGLAKKLIPYGIVVNAIAPGPTATDMLNKDGSDLTYKGSPSGRYADAQEIANAAIFLISDMGRMIVGETVYITGGCGTLTFDDIKY